MLWTITGIGKKGHKPKSVIRHAESVPDWGNEAFGRSPQSLMTDLG